VNNSTLRWYLEKGYTIPTIEVQLWAKNSKGDRTKNGVERRVVRGTSIVVKRNDLPPFSNARLNFICVSCGKQFFTTWGAASIKKSRNCKQCASLQVKDTGCHSYWVDRLIARNPSAKCDISGETDKRFLVLHHLLSRSNGGSDEESNYVILSANYHLAFHVWNGGMNVPCTPDAYFKFKQIESNS
jgi:5-methylcytosine-specific restriction endonuclease McrA